MKKIFDQIQYNRPKSNVFDLSNEHNFTANMGELIPFVVQEVVPGDKFDIKSQVLVRMQPLLAPVVHRVDVCTHYFFVPNRIIYPDWQKFITGGDDGTLEPTMPRLEINTAGKANWAPGRLPDYMGIPPVNQGLLEIFPKEISALPFRAYLEIWNEYYRDQNLQTRIDVDTATTEQLTELRFRSWEKDYFTSCLPFAQKGAEVELPVGSTAPLQIKDGALPAELVKTDFTNPIDGGLEVDAGHIVSDGEPNSDLIVDVTDSHEVDLSSAAGTTVNELRIATRLQEWLEKAARAGSRYIEQIRVHFGITSSDARLQRPEYLGGGKQPVVISEVLSTVEQEGAPQGQMTGHGISVGGSNRLSKRFEEHGHIIGIMSILPRSNYQDGINKKFKRFDKFDYYWPEFAQLGEQEVMDEELSVDYERSEESNLIFGYQSRYADYKYNSGQVSGELRDSLDFWHFGRKFENPSPNLNEDFIVCNPDPRPFAVIDPEVDKLIIQTFNKIKAVRPMPYFNTPTL